MSIRFCIRLMCCLLSVLCYPSTGLSLQPIGSIGNPRVEYQTFLSNETLLRVLYKQIQIVDINTGSVIDTFGERNYVSEVILSPSGSHLVILNYSQDSDTTTIEIWETHTREQRSEWVIPGHAVLAAFSRLGFVLAVSVGDDISLWNWQTSALIGEMRGDRRRWRNCHTYNGGGVCSGYPKNNAMVFTADDSDLIVASQRPDVEVWNVKTRRLKAHFSGHTGNWVEDAVLSPDGRRLATFEPKVDKVYVWDVETQQLLWEKENGTRSVGGVTFSPNSQYLYVIMQADGLPGRWSGEGLADKVNVYEVKSSQQVDAFSGGDFYGLQDMALSPDGKKMLLAYWDAFVLWDIPRKRSLNVYKDFLSTWHLAAMSANGKTFVSVSDYYIKAWNIASEKLQLFQSAKGRSFERFAISSDGAKIAVIRAPWLEVYDLKTGTVEKRIQLPNIVYTFSDIALSPTGRWVAVQGSETIHLFDLNNPENTQTLVVDTSDDTMFTFSENDTYLAVLITSLDSHNGFKEVVIYKRIADTFSFQYAWRFANQQILPERLAFASDADGTPVLAVPLDNETQIFKLLDDQPQLLSRFEVEAAIHFTHDGRYLFANRDHHLKIIDWQNGKTIHQPPIQDYFQVSRDASVLLSYTNTGECLIYDAKQLIPSQPVAVDAKGKQIVMLGAVKRNQLLQNFPNPFNPETWIPFRLAAENDVSIDIYTSTGILVRRLSLGRLPAGEYTSPAKAVYWNGRNQIGEPVSSGVYLYTINAGNFSATRKMLIRK